jgi:hypothetical protein
VSPVVGLAAQDIRVLGNGLRVSGDGLDGCPGRAGVP